MKKKPQRALVLEPGDNVCVILTDVHKGDTVTLKGREGTLQIKQTIEFGHKAALAHIDEGADIIKYGHKIGIATISISPGEWVHLHNMRSVVDPGFRTRIE